MRNNPREALLSVHRRHVKAWEEKNLDQLRTLYWEDAVIFHSEPPSRFSDFKTFENTTQHYFTRIHELSLLTSNIQIEVCGEVAWISSQFLAAFRVNGDLVRQNGRWTEVYQQVDGDWKLVHLHSSVDPSAETVIEKISG